jgi:hypothetical protein
MIRTLVVGFALSVPGLALACGGKNCDDCGHGTTAAAAPAASSTAAAIAVDPAACARKAELVGGNCSYTTAMMAQRVLAEGAPYTFTGSLVASANALESHVAAPYTVGPEAVQIVANAVIESLTTAGADAGRVGLEGMLLEVSGVKYFVVTGYSALTS